MLTAETFLYRNAVEQPLNESKPLCESGREGRDEELLAVMLHLWNNIWKRRQLRWERQKPPSNKAVIYLLTVVKVDQGN